MKRRIAFLLCAIGASLSAAPAERAVTLADGTSMTFVEIARGRFHMGSPEGEVGRARDEGPRREVEISRPFWLGKFEVTQSQWRAVMGENPSTFQDFPASASHPVEGVSWLDAQAFLAKLNAAGVGRFRLPTEAEWEYAARAGTTDRFPWGDDAEYRELPLHAWYYSRAEGRSHPVGRKRPNPWGLHDMFGGVWEWCADWFGAYDSAPVLDPQGPAGGTHRCIRGGSWFNEPEALRCANRHRHSPESRQTNLGLRLVWEPPAAAGEAAVQRRRDGSVPYGFRVSPGAGSGPWPTTVPHHAPVAAGEHPRLLFRRSDLPALKGKAATPEGQAILRRLRFLLDGADGETMTARFNPARAMDGAAAVDLPAGTLTIGHAAGYGLLYQLTGDAKYAEFGRRCFEWLLAAGRDRDARYSYRRPGGALRAGPTLGWLAVGYDLCYNGWDAATRERLGRALVDYDEQMEGARAEKARIDLRQLAEGTMPPYSNHFAMQVGGAALVLLAVDREPWVEQERIDTLREIAAHSMVRALGEGFGDGGVFAEGDGTGSMASQIVLLTALRAWRTAAGRDYFHPGSPHARMLTLKWTYQTVYRDGRPDFWPVRGGYPHNVWSREGMSGAGYFAVGLGGLAEPERAALAWCYRRFLAAADAQRGTPYDTASWYPQFAVCAFVNWPVGQAEIEPSRVLPRIQVDTSAGFLCWRERWRDENDTVITVLTNEVRGYMGAKADSALHLISRGRHLTWGTVTEGPWRHWSATPRGDTSSLTLADGTCFAVDFTGASGVDVMLVTTGKAAGQVLRIGPDSLTFYFPGVDVPLSVRIDGDVAVVGEQRVAREGGNLVLGVKERRP